MSRALALLATAVGILSTLAAVTIPPPHTRTPVAIGIAWLALVITHAVLYWWGDAVRTRVSATTYLVIQTTLVFTIGAAGALYPLAAALYVGLALEAHALVGHRVGWTPIAIIAVVLLSFDAMIVQGPYLGASRGLALLALVLLVSVVARLVGRRGAPALKETVEPVPSSGVYDSELTPREVEVLRAVATGARSATIAADLGIAERTVKAHLANIYQKLGVESRAAAVAEAVRRGLT